MGTQTMPTNDWVLSDWAMLARELGPRFAARASSHDAEDSFVADNYRDLREHRVFSAGVPAELGGGGASHAQLCEMLRVLGQHCGSTALALAMHTHQVAIAAWRWRHEGGAMELLLRRVAAQEAILVTSGGSDWLAGSGRAERVDGGYRITGRKIFASGAPAGDLFMTLAIHDDPAHGPTVLHFAIPFDAPGLAIQDTWRTLGMRGTGSHDIVLDGVFVPDAAIGVRRPPNRWGPWHVVAMPWVMPRGDHFRPGPPPGLTSDTWARDYNEIKAVGARNSTQRTPEQTAIAQFWEATAPVVYWPIARSVAGAHGRDVTDNARLFAVAAMAMDDALIAVFDGKYTYNLWRPVTAIRNGDLDGNNATERDPGWTPFISTPMHPEYPCAHCIVAGALGAVLAAEIGSGPTPKLSSTSPTAGGAVRTWTSVGDFTKEVAQARIYDGVHYRTSTEVGSAMGKKIGELATKSVPKVTR